MVPLVSSICRDNLAILLEVLNRRQERTCSSSGFHPKYDYHYNLEPALIHREKVLAACIANCDNSALVSMLNTRYEAVTTH